MPQAMPEAMALAASHDEIYVSDGDGTTLWVSGGCRRRYGLSAEDLIGRDVRALERRGVYAPSATALALSRGQEVTVEQRTRVGRRLLVTATPVRGPSGRIERVVCNSRDLDELMAGWAGARPAADIAPALGDPPLVCASPSLAAAVERLRRAAAVDLPVFLSGETGVGKSLFAAQLHRWSRRAQGPYLAVHPAALPDSLFEAELFGYDPGAYTGARREGSPGLVRSAAGGTLLLDEIGELPLPLQSKVLSLTDHGEILPLGASRPVRVDVRLVVATHQPLSQLVEDGRFRKDLFYRLSALQITIPPLRERREDIAPLAQLFLGELARRYGLYRELTPAAVQWLEAQPWPGNVRELRHLLERAAVLGNATEIGPDLLEESAP